MRNAGLDEAKAGIKIARKNINNLRYVDDTIVMSESKEELKETCVPQCSSQHCLLLFFFYFILLYNTVLVLPYIDMYPPWVYMRSQT